MLAECGVIVSDESIRRWCLKFGPRVQRALKRREGTLGDDWFVDEVFVSIGGRQRHLWRAVDQDGDVLDILVQHRRDRKAAERFFRKVLKGQRIDPRRVVTDVLRSYPAAVRTVLPGVMHETEKYANNRAENSHQPTRRRERQMQRFKSKWHAQRFPGLHARVSNLFRCARHLVNGANYRLFRALGLFQSVSQLDRLESPALPAHDPPDVVSGY
ncbi:MAG: IS6 family transposase [Gammaproteobacteria bacterium]